MGRFKSAKRPVTWRDRLLTRRNAVGALFLVIAGVALVLDTLPAPDRAVQFDWRSTWMQVNVKADGVSDILEDALQCRSLEVLEARPLVLFPGALVGKSPPECNHSCKLTPFVLIEGGAASFTVQGITLDSGALSLRAGTRKSDWRISLPREAVATLHLPKGTTLRDGNGRYELSTEVLQKLFGDQHLTLDFIDCDMPRLNRREITSLDLSELRNQSYFQSHVLSAKARFLAFKDKTVEVQQGGQIDLSTFPSAMRVLSVGREIVGRAEGIVDRLEVQRGAMKRDQVPSLLEWWPEWHLIGVVLAATLVAFGMGLKLLSWYTRKEQK